MNKLVLVGGIALGAVGATLLVRKLNGSGGYDDDEIDTALGEGDFGNRGAPAPEQKMAPAHTRTDISAEQLSMASRVGEALPAIRKEWPAMTEDEIYAADGDLDKLAGQIAEKAEQPREQVRKRLDDIIATEEPRPSYPAH